MRYPIALTFAALCILLTASALPQPLSHTGAVPQVGVDPGTIRFPVIDGTDIRFSHLTPAQAPSQTRVAQIIQDDQGFLWFGTQQGLNRCDGYRCKVFTHDPKRPDSFGGSFVYSLFKDRSGSIWVGSDQSFDRFDPATESFAHFHINGGDPIVLGFSQDSSGALWLSTEMGLYRLNPQNGDVARYTHHGDDPYSLSSDQVESTGEDRVGNFWVGTGVGIDRFDRNTGKVTLHVPLPELIPGSLCPTCRSFHEDRYGTFWIVYRSGSGLAILDLKRNRLTKVSLYEGQSPRPTISSVISTILEDHSGTMWFGTLGQGLLKFDRTHRRFIRFRNDPEVRESLAENRVISLCEDREGNIWTGFNAMMPDFFANVQSPFQAFRPPMADRSNAGENLVNAIYEDLDGNVWMGAGGVLYRIEHRTGGYKPYYPSGRGVKAEVLAIAQDSSGKLWIGTFGYGLTQFDPKTERIKTYRHKPSDSTSLSNDTVARILINRDGTMWLSTWDGLDRFDPASGVFVTYKLDRNQIEPYFSIMQDRKGLLWLGSKSGLFRFDPSTSQFKVFLHNLHDPSSLSNDTVNSVHQDRAGAIWLGTQDGLDKMDPDKLTFTSYTSKNGLPGNAVSCILTDDQDDLWMSTNQGLSKFNSRTTTFRNYTVADGLPGDDLTGWDACFRASSGEMLFGGFAGAVAFQPSDVRDNTYIPPIVFTDFHLAHGFTPTGSTSPLNKSITAASSLQLRYQERFFSVEFAALGFRSAATNRYRYTLQGLDSDWHEVTSDQRLVSYTALPAGTYKLRVQAGTSRGPWSQPTELRISILPPWWATWWFRTGYIGAFAALLWGIYRLRVHALQREFEVGFEARVNERTRIARDLHDTLLQSFNALLLRLQTAADLFATRPDEAKRTLESTIDQTAQALIEGRDAVQQLRSTSQGSNDLVSGIGSLGKALADGPNGDAPAFHVEVEGAPRDLRPITRDEVYRIAGEALRNAFRHAQARRIEVAIRYDRRQLRLQIRDDGQGIDPQLLRTEGLSGHYGLRGMRERARSLGGELTIWSEVNSGTEVDLTVPSSGAYAKPGLSVFRILAARRQTKS